MKKLIVCSLFAIAILGTTIALAQDLPGKKATKKEVKADNKEAKGKMKKTLKKDEKTDKKESKAK